MSYVTTPSDVLALSRPTDGFLCPLSANTYGIEFINFSISDYETKNIIFEVGRDVPAPQDMTLDFSLTGEDMYRKIKYTFSEDVLRLPLIQTSLMFAVGHRELREFRMIERHYFRNELVKSFDFAFGFCIPGSTNNWDAVYSLPPLSESLIAEMIDSPYETQSDSFYFVDNKLVMHNKASYRYVREDNTNAQAKRSYEDKYGSKGVKATAAKSAKAAAKVTGGSGAAAKDGGLYLDTEEEDESLMTADEKLSALSLSSGAKSGAKSNSGAKEYEGWSKEADYI